MPARVDLHLHSGASFDCHVSPADVWDRCQAVGLGPVFLTDHDTLEGVRQLELLHPGTLIPGEEIKTREGEIIGLFLTETIPPGLAAADAVDRIRAQGGLVYLEHPYDDRRRSLSEDAIEHLAPLIDIVEVFNGRSPVAANRKAADLCEILRAVPGAGSDAHTLGEIGSVQIEMEEFSGAQDFLAKLRQGTIRHPRPTRLAARSWLRRWSVPGGRA